MSVVLKLDNFSANNTLDDATLDADVAAGVSTLTLIDNSGLVANDFIIVAGRGTEGSEKAQILSLSGSTGVTLTGPLSFKHYRFDPITRLFGDKLKIYAADNVDGSIPADGSFSALAGMPINMNWGENWTVYTDPTGSSSRWYKYSYFNSASSSETDLADSPAVRGAGYSAYCSVSEIRDEAGLQGNQFITDAMLDGKRFEAQGEIDSALVGLYVVPFQSPINARIREITVKLAAGKILSQDYGPMSSGNSKSGTDKLTEGRNMLKALANKDDILTDVTGTEMVIDQAGGTKSFPNVDTPSLPPEQGGSTRRFRMSDRM